MKPFTVPLFFAAAIVGIILSDHRMWAAATVLTALSILFFWSGNRYLWASLAGLPLFFLYATAYTHYYLPTSDLPPAAFSSLYTISSMPVIDGDKISFWAEHREKEIGKVYVSYTAKNEAEWKSYSTLQSGEKCLITGELAYPEHKRNQYGMDFPRYLKQKGAMFVLEPRGFPERCIPPDGNVFFLLSSLRQKGVEHVNTRFSEPSAGLINALLFGERSGIPPHVTDAYQELGLTHLLAVSGYNIAVLIGLLFVVLSMSGLTKEKIYLVILLAIPAYTLLTGAESSIIRAGIMGSTAAFFLFVKRRLMPVNVIGTAFLLMLLYNPYTVYNLGFQLSFYMTFVLICSKNILLAPGTSFLVMLRATLLCQIASLPFILYHFFEISFWSLPLNALYIPFVSLLLFPLALFIVPLGAMFSSLTFLDYILHLFIKIATNILMYAANHTQPFIFGRPSLLFLAGYMGASWFFFTVWDKKKKFFPLALLPLAVVMLLHMITPYFRDETRVTFLDVGQGDSAIIELPNRKGIYLIDTGGTLTFAEEKWRRRKRPFDVTRSVVLPSLKGMGIRKIDALLLTHSDVDHAGGAEVILSNMKVDTLYYPFHQQKPAEIEKEIFFHAAKRQVKIVKMKEGMTWRRGSGLFTVLSPDGSEEESNEQSIVIWSKLSGRSFLFTGDIEEKGEARLSKTYDSFKTDVLKVAHHGSRTSSAASFLQKAQPHISVISAGKNNRYGHPDREVVERLKKTGSSIYRTDTDGDIIITVKKGRLKVRKTMNKN
ncbi:DNA internalization-related competence protein ComEC/Rec2 [Fictibacillus iocasae]|uniref:DNA internalization-related competence protein ComEC/Rec2 n=1 Tax=Fictibacillus iocasae TaxID=2715437 RepID=A0ABW2NVQ7_9BACL